MQEETAQENKIAQDTFQLPAVLKQQVNQLAIKLGLTRNVIAEGGLTGKRAPLYVDMVRFAFDNQGQFLEWRANRDRAAVLGVSEQIS